MKNSFHSREEKMFSGQRDVVASRMTAGSQTYNCTRIFRFGINPSRTFAQAVAEIVASNAKAQNVCGRQADHSSDETLRVAPASLCELTSHADDAVEACKIAQASSDNPRFAILNRLTYILRVDKARLSDSKYAFGYLYQHSLQVKHCDDSAIEYYK